MNHIEAMKQALETLEHIDYEDNDRGFLLPYQCTMLDNAIIAIKQALNDAPHLAAPVQELTNLQRHEQNVRKFLAAQPAPVQEPRPISDFPELQEAVRKGLADGSLTIQGAAPVQEPVCAMCKSTHGKWSWMCGRCLLIHDKQPPAAQRQWVGLTLADKEEFLTQDFGGSRLDAMDWAARKLKEKNHG